MITVYALVYDNSDSSYTILFFRNKKIVDGLLELDQFLCNEGVPHEFFFPNDFDFETANIEFSDYDVAYFYGDPDEIS